jgi:DNA-binding HxlR family transcriptional regulator
MTEGYIYCLSNESMPGLVKVGMTGTPERTPDMRAKELSVPSGVPTPFKVEFAKLVSDPKQKEQLLHDILSESRYRMNREFFSTSPEQVMKYFGLTDGTMWEDNKNVEDEHEEGGIRNIPNYVPTGTWDFYILEVLTEEPKTENEITQSILHRHPEKFKGKTSDNTINYRLQKLVREGNAQRAEYKKGNRYAYKYFVELI